MDLNLSKLKELILLICEECRDPDKLGAVKLHKILWFSDGRFFTRTGESITGESYIKKQYGPFSSHLNALVEELQAEHRLYVRDVDFHGLTKKEFIAKGRADRSLFTEKELRIVLENVKNICDDHTAASISEKTHNAVWEAAELNEEIPYEALWAARGGKIPDEIVTWAQEQYVQT